MDAMSSQLLEKADTLTKYICIVGIATGKMFADKEEFYEVKRPSYTLNLILNLIYLITRIIPFYRFDNDYVIRLFKI